ncbi:glycosyltransferase family 2 protein [Nitrosospira multiformis]|nr:glycosyltransferase family 2 protein [Nitrosospira multiformis]
MVKNEKGIIQVFSAHVLSLFDRIIFIDHLSSDGTRKYIETLSQKHPNLECYFFDEPGYYQSELMTWAAQNLVDNEIPGWVFFLDADEFLPFKSKEEFDNRLSQLGSYPVISMPWLNLVPIDMESDLILNQVFLKPASPSRFLKIAFQPNLISIKDFFIAQGNHALFAGTRSSKVKYPAKNGFPIYHLPIRTKTQLREKILQGVEAYRQMGGNRRGKIGSHWYDIYRIMEANSLTNELMAGIAAKYSSELEPPYERSLDELRENGYGELKMEICVSEAAISFNDAVNGSRSEAATNGDEAHLSINKGKELMRAPQILDQGNNSLGEKSQNNRNNRKIYFDKSDRSIQIIGE